MRPKLVEKWHRRKALSVDDGSKIRGGDNTPYSPRRNHRVSYKTDADGILDGILKNTEMKKAQANE
ncbi:peptide chain release factor 2 [Edwardsiella piscicida]|nr:peptide chain release factor 2 [Edwardsiella piscicida]GBK54067.1 peptide chain release factor 2 [Edwardsiella piscicida]GBK58902.1 peptide chain release factor 2 [Edwardsiella piscicida]